MMEVDVPMFRWKFEKAANCSRLNLRLAKHSLEYLSIYELGLTSSSGEFDGSCHVCSISVVEMNMGGNDALAISPSIFINLMHDRLCSSPQALDDH